MKLIQVNKDNEKYFSQDFIDGFNLGAKTQYEKDMEALAVKQIPKQAIIRAYYIKGYEEPIDYGICCPDCEMHICHPTEYEAKENYKYCPRCGNRIEWDWSDEGKTASGPMLVPY